MRPRAAMLLLAAGMMGVTALSVGGRIYWLMLLMLLMVFLVGLVSCLWAYFTMRVAGSTGAVSVARGAPTSISYTLRHQGLLPIAPVRLLIYSPEAPEGMPTRVIVKPFQGNICRQRIHCPHVGVYAAGVRRWTVEDVFGLFALSRQTDMACVRLTVLPRVLPTGAMPMSPGDDESLLMARASEDNAAPADVRAYQQGDELKKVHWKLTMRKRELLVKTFEQPMRPDALILLDIAKPDCNPERFYDVRDTLLEQAASLVAELTQKDAPVRIPLATDPPQMLAYARHTPLQTVRETLAGLDLSAKIKFENVLLGETRRMQRNGGIAVLTTRLTPMLADLLLRFRRMGPRVRLYLVRDVLDEDRQLLMNRLSRSDVEVRLVQPEQGEMRKAF